MGSKYKNSYSNLGKGIQDIGDIGIGAVCIAMYYDGYNILHKVVDMYEDGFVTESGSGALSFWNNNGQGVRGLTPTSAWIEPYSGTVKADG